jgi:hypothetical protein
MARANDGEKEMLAKSVAYSAGLDHDLQGDRAGVRKPIEPTLV